MIEIVGYWVSVSLCILPMLFCVGWILVHHMSRTFEKYAGKKHVIKWYENWYRKDPSNLEATLLTISGIAAIIEAFIFLATTANYFLEEPPVHDYLLFMKFVGEFCGAFVGWSILVALVFVGFHHLLVGYAKCLNLSDKIKEKEGKNV